MQRSFHDIDAANTSELNRHAPSSTVNFTFVNQAEDLVSLSHRKISNQQQRHVIRSHVMQRVRQVESAQGKKRSTGRENTKKANLSKSRTKSNDSDSSPNGDSMTITPLPVARKQESKASKCNGTRHSSLDVHSPPRYLSMNATLPVHDFDPFDTLPTNGLSHQSSESLLQYCFDVLLPLTFSVETKQARDRLARQGMVLQSKISSPAVFLGFMATVAAHRAILWGRHRDLAPSDASHDDLITDPEYIKVKHEAMVAVRRIFEKRKTIDHDMVEACFGLISTATVVGNFEEAKLHLKGIARLIQQVNSSEEAMMWVPISNVKVSVGLLSRPLLPLLFERKSIPVEVLERISPPPGANLARSGSGFMALARLSDRLKGLLSTGSDICHFCELSATDPLGLSSSENVCLRNKATELEYDLLAYPYAITAFRQNENNEPQIPALEAVVRLAALGLLSFAPHTIMPSTGLGRALTYHQRRAVEEWLNDQQDARCEVSELRVVCWALFVFTQNASKQVEEIFFTSLLAQITRELWLSTWPGVETIIYEFLYIPRLQSSIWERIWTEAQKVEQPPLVREK